MKYEFVCSACDHVQTVDMGVSELDKAKETGTACEVCADTAYYKFNVSGVQFCFKGDAWSDKNFREKKYRKARSAYMADRQSKHHKTPTLKPNYKGQETGSWREAQEAARSEGKVSETYEPLVRREQAQKGS